MSVVVVKWVKVVIVLSLHNKIEYAPLTKIHCDLWGPTPIASVQNYKYYVIFVDDHTRYTWLYTLKKKSNFFNPFSFFNVW